MKFLTPLESYEMRILRHMSPERRKIRYQILKEADEARQRKGYFDILLEKNPELYKTVPEHLHRKRGVSDDKFIHGREDTQRVWAADNLQGNYKINKSMCIYVDNYFGAQKQFKLKKYNQ